MTWRHIWWIIFGSGLLCSGLGRGLVGLDDTVSLFIRAPEYHLASLSADGKYVAVLCTRNDHIYLATYCIESGKWNTFSMQTVHDVCDYTWASNESIVAQTSVNKQYAHKVFVVDRDLTHGREDLANVPLKILHGLPGDPEHVLLWLLTPHWTNAPPSWLALFNTKTGKLTQVSGNTNDRVLGWGYDELGNPRMAIVYGEDKNGSVEHLFRGPGQTEWQKVDLGGDVSPVGFGSTDSLIYVSGYMNKDTRGVYLYNLKTCSPVKTVWRSKFFDFYGKLYESVERSDCGGIVLSGLSYYEEYPRQLWFDTVLAEAQRYIDRKLPGTFNRLIDWDTAHTTFLIESQADTLPTRYILCNVSTDELSVVAKSRSWLDGLRLCRQQAIWYVASDSIRTLSYLTLPHKPLRRLPLVVLLHGGPWSRDQWGFDERVQLLANQGYAVLQVNYRGSKGFGLVTSERSKFSFHTMPTDVIGAVRALMRSGLIDSARIAIMGASFGGYLAAQCAALYPGTFRCCICEAGIYDWEYQLRVEKGRFDTYAYELLNANLGPGEGRDVYLKSISPITRADKITAKVLLAAGTEDVKVSAYQLYRFARALRRAGNRPRKFVVAYERHGFRHEQNLLAYWKEVIGFLRNNL